MAGTSKASGKSGAKIVGNASWLIFGEIIGRVASFMALLHLTRQLPLASIGAIEFGMSSFGMLNLVVLGGAEVLATRRAARSARALRSLAGTFWALSFGGFALGMGVVALRSIFLPPDVRWTVLGFAAAAGVVPLGLRFALQGRERMGILALGNAVSLVAWFLGVLMLVHGPQDLAVIPFIWIGAQSVKAAIQFRAFRRWFGTVRLHFRRRVLKVWARAVLPVSIGRISQGAMYVIDILLLAELADLAQVGTYGVALKLPLFVVAIAQLVNSALFPTISRLVPGAGRQEAGQFVLDMAKLAFSLATPAALALYFVSAPLMQEVFGEAWQASGALFAILIWRAPISAQTGLFRLVIWSAEPAKAARLSTGGLVVAILSILVLTPSYGPEGCAVGMLIGESTILLSYVVASRKWLHFKSNGHILWALRVVAGLALVVVFATLTSAEWPRWLIVVTGIISGAVAGLLPNIERVPQLIKVLKQRKG